jgi:hypothetical protein
MGDCRAEQTVSRMNNQDRNKEKVASLAAAGLRVDFADLLPGDILLFRPLNPDDLEERVSATTQSPYTHAAIYLGNNEIAESVSPEGVQVQKLSNAEKEAYIIGVLRSQAGFSERRVAAMRAFVDKLVAQGARYDVRGALSFQERKDEYIEKLLDTLATNYGTTISEGKLAQMAYLCSALVVACYTISGVIGDSAQVVYRPNVFSAADLHRDPTFGWLLGYIAKNGQRVPLDDPLLTVTRWQDHPKLQWWRTP